MRIPLHRATQLLRESRVVAIPTETVYGLAAALSCEKAIKHIFTLKKRPADNPLIIHLNDLDSAAHYTTNIPEDAKKLFKTFSPGPLTLVLPANTETVPSIVRGGLETVAIRIPNHPVMRSVIEAVGPIVAPSANISGKPSSTSASHIETDFGRDFPTLHSDEKSLGIESTILIYQDDKFVIGRLGAISPEEIGNILGYTPMLAVEQNQSICPGSKHPHYAPKATLNTQISSDTDAILGYEDRSYPTIGKVISLGRSDAPNEILQNLYASLRMLDTLGLQQAYIDLDLPREGLYLTVLERFERAMWKK